MKLSSIISNININFNNENVSPLPSGGTTGQILTKNSDLDGDVIWKTVNFGGVDNNYKKSTISQDYEIRTNDPFIHYLTPSASELCVKLPPIEYIEIGTEYKIFNLSNEYSLSIKDSIGLTEYVELNKETGISLVFTGDTYIKK